ncbi:hypothetical protein PPYR_04595 [Photinus pyralis]|uniref:Uncharacterized protein n=1 Tax=Photinus pyralis TaxID=7054 RepID=A0A5N4AYJ8_PHOPY|nr:uncharacterized protein LOC116164555 [Photinus pyralis]KAB0802409.1 hypothetical protein PPYR_04595 [Photinus pyralis]
MVRLQFLGCLIGFTLFVDVSVAIDCYQCSSTSNKHSFQCNEAFGKDHQLSAEPCDAVYGAKYCIKHTGRFEGGIGTKRFCSSLDLGNYCDYINQPGDILTYRTCIHTCSGHGCNSSGQNLPGVFLILSVLLIGSFKWFPIYSE